MPVSSTCTFSGSTGAELHARLELPEGPVRATALFAHCFTCSADLRVERQLTAALSAQGLAVLSFDFTGIGRSGGELADSTFSANVGDLRAAAGYLEETLAAPALLVGHSLGGAAVLSAAPSLPSVRAVATIGAPADPQHVEHALDGDLAAVRRDRSGAVTIAGRTFTISRAFLDDLDQGSPAERIAGFRGATLLLHSPVDEVVGIDNAELLYRAARHPKSFVSLDDADHLVTSPREADYAASVITAWAARYLPEDPVEIGPGYDTAGATARNAGGLTTAVDTRGFRLTVDEPASAGGAELGPTPYDHLATALASCTVMTIRLYAERKGWALGPFEASVTHDRVHAVDCSESEKAAPGHIDRLDRVLSLPDDASEEQRTSLLRIADRCPVHRTLEGRIEVHTRVARP